LKNILTVFSKWNNNIQFSQHVLPAEVLRPITNARWQIENSAIVTKCIFVSVEWKLGAALLTSRECDDAGSEPQV
jgi:hypothetical protein